MKKLVFSVLAIALLSSTAAFADGGKGKKQVPNKSCSKACPKSKDCGNTATCPSVQGCVCH